MTTRIKLRTFLILLTMLIAATGALGQRAAQAGAAGTSAPADAIVVDSLVDLVINNGNCSLREALKAANQDIPVDGCARGSSFDVDVITFAVDGTYAVNDQYGPLVVEGWTTIAGNGRTQTILDGGFDTQIMVVNSDNRPVHIKDLTFTHGMASFADNAGGAINNWTGDLLIDNVLFEFNTAELGLVAGGGAIATHADLQVTNSDFDYNSAASSYNGGGAIIAEDANVQISNTGFFMNSADHAWGGGAIHLSEGSLNMQYATFDSNQADDSEQGGGALYLYGIIDDPLVFITGSTFRDNHAFDTTYGADTGGGAIHTLREMHVSTSTFAGNEADRGGAMYGYLDWTIVDSSFTENVAHVGDGGGLLHEGIGPLAIEGSTFSQNSALLGSGGGLKQASSEQLNVLNSTFSLNAAVSGAGLVVGGDGLMRFSTVVNNTNSGLSGQDGYGVKIGPSADLELSNSLLAYNSPANCLVEGTQISAGYNLFGDDSCNAELRVDIVLTGFNADLIGPLQDNGGQTETHALLRGSPALDNGQCHAAIDTDQRGIGRPQGARCDIGAFEAEQTGGYQLYMPIILFGEAAP